MALPDGKTCADCVFVYRCTLIFGAEESNTDCDFFPRRFYPAESTKAEQATSA